jgi:hypothetical protein
VTAIGKIEVIRTYRSCSSCGDGGFPADLVLGVDGGFTRRARRSICHVGVDNSFDRGERTLRELTGWSVDAETIRRLCHAEAEACRRSRARRLDVATNFAEAAGDWELQIDAGKVNTETGWRDVKVATFAVRERAEPCTSEGYKRRDLPEPSVRHVIAGIEPAEAFGPRCKAEAETIGLPEAKRLSILGDGAAWIWNLSAEHFAGAEQTLDLYHATEYLADLARAGSDGDTATAKAWTDRAQLALVADGWAGACEFVHEHKAELSNPRALEAAFPRAANYLSGHRDRMAYAARLYRGAPVGSGMIEGAIKQLVGRRIKQTGARWKADRVGPMVELISLGHTEDWDAYWSVAA